MSDKKEVTKVANLSLKKSEIRDLERISIEVLGHKNKSGMVRYWINQYKKNRTW